MKIYDVVVVGGGLAGLSAGWILNMNRTDFLIIAEQIGGKIVESPLVNLFPFVKMSGREMVEWFLEKIPKERIIHDRVEEIDLSNAIRRIKCVSGNEYLARGVIIATGGVQKEFKFKVPYKTCIMCELPFLKGKRVCIVYDDPHYLSVVGALKDCKYKVYHISEVSKVRFVLEKEKGYKYYVNGEEFDELFYLSEPEPRVDIKGVPNVKPNCRFKILPLVYLAGDVVPQKPYAVFAVASGIVSALNILDELYVHRVLTAYFAQTKDVESGLEGVPLPELNRKEEIEKVIRSNSRVLLVWHSIFCAPCFVYENVLKRFVREYKLPVYMVNADKIDVKQYGIRAVPTTIYYVNGKEVWRREGVLKYEKLLELLSL